MAGRPQHSIERDELSGSWQAKTKRKAAKAALKPRIAPIDRIDVRVSLDDMERVARLLPDYDPWRGADAYYFDPRRARVAIMFFHCRLSHVKGEKARTAFYLEDWEQGLIGNLFGWCHKETGLRRYRECLIFIPRKNSKTTLAAGIINLVLFQDGEPGAEIYGAAAEYGQASYVFAHARGMVIQCDRLMDRAQIYKGQSKAIVLEEDFSSYKVISGEASTSHGGNTHCAVIDELHAQPNRDLVDTLLTSTGARREPLIIYTTTSDFEREGSICNEKLDYAKRVAAGTTAAVFHPGEHIDDPSFLPVIYEATLDDDWTDPEVWRRVNPNLGVSLSMEYLERECKRAIETPAAENTFKRLHLNIRTEQDVRWLSMDKWDACAGSDIDLADYRGRECYAGLDLATTRDMTAFVMAFPEKDGTVTLIPRFWIPNDWAMKRAHKDRIPYDVWLKQGLITKTSGERTDYAAVRAGINALVDKDGIHIKEIAADRLFQGEQICQELREGDGFNVLAFGQGFRSMPGPTKRFDDLVHEGQLHHGGNPILRWHAGNASVEMNSAGDMKPCRKKSAEKIDGIVAAIMAVGRLTENVDKPGAYKTRGVRVV